VGRFGGLRGPPQRGSCPVCALKGDAFSFGFLQVLSRVSPVVLGDPQGCSRHIVYDFSYDQTREVAEILSYDHCIFLNSHINARVRFPSYTKTTVQDELY
jgi:hypothetical protein